MKHWLNDTDAGKLKHSEENLPHCYFMHSKFHMAWPGIEPQSRWWKAGQWQTAVIMSWPVSAIDFVDVYNEITFSYVVIF
jgi:hypothetical protein